MNTNQLLTESIRLNQEITAAMYRIKTLHDCEERTREIQEAENKLQKLEEIEDKLEVALLTGSQL